MADPRLVELFLETAALPGLSGQERPVADYVRRFLGRLGFSVEEDDAGRAWGGDAGNVVARLGGGGDTILLAHMDTARPTAPGRAVLKADRIVSDGSGALGVDCRVGVATLLWAAEQAVRHGRARREMTLGFTICEETTLAGSLALRWPETIRQGVLFDSSLRPGSFIARSYGCQRVEATITGRAAHSGIAPERGINALSVAVEALAGMPLGRIDDETTANVGTLTAGTAINVVPERAHLVAEVRSLRPHRVDEVVRLFETRLRQAALHARAGLDFSAGWDFEPYTIAPEAPVYRAVTAALTACGLTPSPRVSAGGSDANSLNARGLPVINIGTGAQNPHGDDEYVLFEDLGATGAIALALLGSGE